MTRRLPVVALLLATAAAPVPHGAETHAARSAGAPDAHGTAATGPSPEGAAAAGRGGGKLAPFAAALAQQAPGDVPRALAPAAAWQALIRSTRGDRQAARWALARALLERDRAAEAEGVLAVMRADEPDLAFVPAWRLASGAAAAALGRSQAAMAALADPELAAQGEACAWRMRILADDGLHSQAVQEFRCAIPALESRPLHRRAPFLLALARSAVAIGAPAQAIGLLAPLPDRDPAANLLRGKALIAQKKFEEGRLRIDRARVSGSAPVRAAAELARIEAEHAAGTLDAAAARRRLDRLMFGWRGDRVEQDALLMGQRLAEAAHDMRGTLHAAATLFRHFDLGDRTRPTLERVQALLAGLVGPQSSLPLPEAAGLYWEYRDLAPTGGAGDALAAGLAQRLADAGLHARAAELLAYQMDNRAADVAKGPLSVRVAELQIMAGRPDRALAVIRDSEGPHYPDAMLADRRRISAVALFRMGKRSEALALAELIPDAAPVRSQMLWAARDWKAFAATNRAALPEPAAMDPAGEARVLRQAVALAMTGDDAGLAALRGRYLKGFAGRRSAPAFRMLTGAPDRIEPGAIDAALAAMPAQEGGDLAAMLSEQG